MRRHWREHFEDLRPFRSQLLDDTLVAEIETLALEFLAGRDALFVARISADRIVDGHGDLLADQLGRRALQ